jgi:hypothetical protein
MYYLDTCLEKMRKANNTSNLTSWSMSQDRNPGSLIQEAEILNHMTEIFGGLFREI